MSIRNFNSNSTSWFVLVGEGLEKVSRGGTHSFRGYTDHANAHKQGVGAYIEYVTSTDQNGRKKGKWFVMDESRRKFQVREGEQDINQITQYDFLKFCPDCEGSPNGAYVDVNGVQVQQGIMFRELNSAADAAIALEADSKRVNAQAECLKLDPQTLQELAAHIGVFGQPDKLMLSKVFEWVGRRPDDFKQLLNSGDRTLRAVVKKALADGILSQKGELIYWGSTLVGADEDAAIATLARDKQMYDVLAAKINLQEPAKIPFSTPANPKKRGPKPGSKRNSKTADKSQESDKSNNSL